MSRRMMPVRKRAEKAAVIPKWIFYATVDKRKKESTTINPNKKNRDIPTVSGMQFQVPNDD